MNVKLIAVTQSEIKNNDGVRLSAEELIVFIARVSNPSNQLNLDTSQKLIEYCIKKRHWSPFDMVNLTVEVKTSRAIAQQILRHWSIKPQEFSQRYAEVVDMEPIQIRRQAATNRQSSTEDFDPEVSENYRGGKYAGQPLSVVLEKYVGIAQELYTEQINLGVAKECARMILPLTTQTTMYLNGSVRSWIHYLMQRTDHHAQLEHRQVAAEIKAIFAEIFPNVTGAVNQIVQARYNLDVFIEKLKTASPEEVAQLVSDFEAQWLDKIGV